ncbi:hypothetical protein MAR_013214, partial [Mya arenaria]
MYDFSIIIARVLVEFFPWLKFAKSIVHQTIQEVPEGLKSRNTVIPLPILHNNEQKYAEVIDVLDSYQELCEAVYESAEKPLPKIHIGGDQLTSERFSGAKRLRAAALTATELKTLEPITFELFRLQMTVLTAFYQLLYDTEKSEVFTLHNQKVFPMRKDAEGNDVKNHYDSCRELATSVIKAYIIEAACEHFGLPDAGYVPENIPDHQNMSTEEIRLWLVSQINPIITSICSISRGIMTRNDIQVNNTDDINSYGNVLIEVGLVFMELADIVETPNRERLLLLMKYLMLILKGHNTNSKYALELLRFLSQQLALPSQQDAHEVVYGLFVNTGNTIIPSDLQMEHLVRLTKEVFDTETSRIKRSQKHRRLSSIEDEKKILKDLRVIRPLLKTAVRQANSLKRRPKHPVAKLNIVDFIKWIEKNKLKFYYE